MDFIEIYDNSLTKKQCDTIIELFEYHSDAHHKGLAGGNYDPKKKKGKSLDFSVDQTIWDAKDRALASIILYPLHKALGKFKKKYPYLDELQTWGLNTDYHMQRFDKDDGYFAIHCEQELHTCKRVLAWMYYLNNAKCGTKFYHQNRTIRARQGRLLIWPAGWTHMHSGVVPNIDKKYIITGWYSFYDEREWM